MTLLQAPPARAPRIGIIGAGVAGLGAALALQSARAEVTIIENSRGPSGRAATRRRDGVVYDHGANFIDLAASAEVAALFDRVVPSSEVVEIAGAIWTHDAAGRRSPGRAQPHRRASLRNGISQLGRTLLAASGAAIHTSARAVSVVQGETGWEVQSEEGATYGPFEGLVLTPPAPQAAHLLTGEGQADLRTALERVSYRSQFSVVLALAQALSAHAGIYAYLNTDRAHDIAWLSFESRKAGHVPDGQEVLIVQMAPAWTVGHFDADRDEVARRAAASASRLLGEALDVAWHDVQRWTYALPNEALDSSARAAAEQSGLYVASDAVVGKGRVAEALEVGLETGRRIAEWLGQQNTSVK